MSSGASVAQVITSLEGIQNFPIPASQYDGLVLLAPANDYQQAIPEPIKIKEKPMAGLLRWAVDLAVPLIGALGIYILNGIKDDISTLKTDVKNLTASVSDTKVDFLKQLNQIDKSISSVDNKASITNQRLDDIGKTLKPPR